MTPEAGKTPLPVFLSHNRQDRELVREIAEALELEFGIPHYLDEYAIPAGEAFRPWIERAIETSTGCAIFLGGNGWGPTHLWEAERALAHYRKTPGFRLIPVILPGATADDMARLGSGSVFKEINWVDFTKGPRDWQSLEKFREAVTGQRRDGTRGPARLTPYLLRRDAARWQASGGKDRSLLYRGHELQEAERVAVENPDLAGGNEVTLFLSACTRHERNRLRTLATISIAVALALAGLSLFAWQQQQEADVQRDEAVKQQGIARKQTEIALTEKSIADKERQKAVEQRQIADQQRKIAEQQTKRAQVVS